jgi:hypothetical protein
VGAPFRLVGNNIAHLLRLISKYSPVRYFAFTKIFHGPANIYWLFMYSLETPEKQADYVVLGKLIDHRMNRAEDEGIPAWPLYRILR